MALFPMSTLMEQPTEQRRAAVVEQQVRSATTSVRDFVTALSEKYVLGELPLWRLSILSSATTATLQLCDSVVAAWLRQTESIGGLCSVYQELLVLSAFSAGTVGTLC